MGYLRTGLVLLYLIFYFLIGYPVRLVIYLRHRGDEPALYRAYFSYVQWGFRCVLFCAGIRVSVIGEERVPRDQAVLFVGNHRSIFDIVTVIAKSPIPLSPISKNSMAKVPFLSTWMRLIRSQFLDRSDIQNGAKMVADSVELIRTGHSIFIYPEGTRNKEEGTLLPFHGGSFKIAIRSNAPVVPVTFVNTGDIFEPHMPSIHRQHVIMEYGEPILTEGMSVADRKALPEKAREIIAETYERDRELI